MPSPPPPKKKRVENNKDELPNILQGEIARLPYRFRISLDPAHHLNSKTVHLICKLGKFDEIKLILAQFKQGLLLNMPPTLQKKNNCKNYDFLVRCKLKVKLKQPKAMFKLQYDIP